MPGNEGSSLQEARTFASRGEWLDAIEAYTTSNREHPDRLVEAEILGARREAFLAFRKESVGLPAIERARALPVLPEVGLPVLRGELDADVVRATIAAHGSVVVKGLFDDAVVARMLRVFDGALGERDAARAGTPIAGDGWHSESPLLRFPWYRVITSETGGLLAVDSARGIFECFEVFERVGITRLVAEYFGSRPAFAAEKMVFRRVTPEKSPPPGAGWHQDGSFMHTDDRVLNVWVALTPCGETAPSLEILPVRVDRILDNQEGLLLASTIFEAYPDVRTVVPLFEPGDALLFDHKCVHRTGYVEGMPGTRLAIECWTFAPGNVPRDYTGLIL